MKTIDQMAIDFELAFRAERRFQETRGFGTPRMNVFIKDELRPALLAHPSIDKVRHSAGEIEYLWNSCKVMTYQKPNQLAPWIFEVDD